MRIVGERNVRDGGRRLELERDFSAVGAIYGIDLRRMEMTNLEKIVGR